MSLVTNSIKKCIVIAIYLLIFLGLFKIQEIIFSPTMKNLENLFLCIILAIVVSYINGFILFKGPAIKK